ncbi:hypothetical protein BX666DRAFT_379309 [Dichotomocladium elegans]|nr:hypothetical protein BX666DRAFT_379309 [Dichotomocladium elegans]
MLLRTNIYSQQPRSSIMIRRTCLLHRLRTPLQRSFTSRSLDDRNKKLIQEIKDLEHQAEAQRNDSKL